MPLIANTWRISRDIAHTFSSILNNIDDDELWAPYAGPGSIADPDMLQVTFGQIGQMSLNSTYR